jgi:hypothetical protein
MAETTTTVTTSEGVEPTAGGEVAGVVAGAAAVEAANASEEAAEAEAAAEAAQAEAAGAEAEARAAYEAALAADARALSTEEKLDALATLHLHEAQQRAAAQPATPAAAEGETKAKDEPPKDLAKKQKRKTLREWYEGG